MVKAIIFDLDNTLIDFVRMKKLSCEAAIDAMIDAGLDMSRKEAMRELFKLYSKYGWEYQKIFQIFLRKVRGKVDYPIMSAGIVAYRRVKEGLLYSYPKVNSTLLELKKKYKLIILSDAPRIQAWIRLAAMRMNVGYFDYIITFDDTKRRKPDMKPFRFALKRLGLKPGEVAMVGDSFYRDLNPAKKLGMTTIFAKYGSDEKGKADYTLKNVSDLLKIF